MCWEDDRPPPAFVGALLAGLGWRGECPVGSEGACGPDGCDFRISKGLVHDMEMYGAPYGPSADAVSAGVDIMGALFQGRYAFCKEEGTVWHLIRDVIAPEDRVYFWRVCLVVYELSPMYDPDIYGDV